MPNHKTHDIITVVTGAAFVPLAYTVFINHNLSVEASRVDTALLVGAHLLSGIMFSPDLDINSAIDDRWGPLRWIWRPYMWVMPHGDFFSHGLVIAPLLRLLYFFLAITILFLGLTWGLGKVGIILPDYYLRTVNYLLSLWQNHRLEVELVLIGFITGSAVHSIADWLITQHTHRHHH